MDTIETTISSVPEILDAKITTGSDLVRVALDPTTGDVIAAVISPSPDVIQVRITDQPDVVSARISGQRGPPGPAGSSTDLVFTRIAGQDLSAFRVVTPLSDMTVVYADSATLTDVTKPLWLTLDAGLTDDPVRLTPLGNVTDSSWGWTPGLPVFLGQNGVLTQTSPTLSHGDVFIVQVASPDTATDVFYCPRNPIIL